MKQHISTQFRQILSHRALVIAIAVLAIISVIGIIIVIAGIAPSELRVVTHYSAYGVTHFYRDQWLYYFSFALFIFLAAIFSIAIGAKLQQRDKAPIAVALIWGVVAIIIFSLLTHARLLEFL